MRKQTRLKTTAGLLFLAAIFCIGSAQAQRSTSIPNGAKVYIASMDGFDTYLKKAFESKHVPLTVVDDRSQADYEITGTANSQKAGTVKKLMGNWHSREEASINVIEIKSGETVYAYSAHKEASAHGKKSTAEACAKHIKDKIGKHTS